MKHITLLFALMLISCNNQQESNVVNESTTIPNKNMTLWTNQTELFVEFPALVVGEVSRFAAHFTLLEKHQPIREGSVKVSLIKDGKGIRNSVDAPSSPGIFSPTLQPIKAGNYQLIFDITTSTYSDTLIIHDVIVYSTKEEAIIALGESEDDGGISFLKEQAWKIDFQTTPVTTAEIYDVINTYGVWTHSVGSVKSLVSKANGIVDFTINNLTEGTEVKKGQLLMNLSSQGLSLNNLNTEIVNARANFEQAKSEYERKRELYEIKIVPKSEFEKAENNYLVAKSTYQSLSTGVSGSGKEIRAPFNGFIKSISVSNGDYVEQGIVLISIGTHQSRLLETQIAPYSDLTMENVQEIWYESKNGEWQSVKKSGGTILSIGKSVDHEKPFISVFAEVNQNIDMPEGSLTGVQIALGNANKNTMIPVNALLEDYGSFSVIVQLSGESFERRAIKIGKRNGKNVEIIQGLEVGEVVVSIGAYQVKMASMSGSTPSHGHEH